MITAHVAIMDANSVKKPAALEKCLSYRALCDKLNDLAAHNQDHPEDYDATRAKMFPLAVEAIAIYDSL